MKCSFFSGRWLAAAVLVFVCASGCGPTPPVAKRIPTQVMQGGEAVIDPYWWLRDKSDPAVIQYLKAENAYTATIMKPTEKLQDRLYKEMSDRLPAINETVPYRDGEWWYSTLNAQDKDYPVYLRRHGSPGASAQTVMDANVLAAGHAFFDYRPGSVSDDGNLLAFATDITGNRQYVMQVKDLHDGTLRGDTIRLVDSFDWAADNKTIYYVKENSAKCADQLFRHVLGQPVEMDKLLYEEKDEQFSISVARTRDRKFLILSSQSTTTSDARAIPADGGGGMVLIEPRVEGREYFADHRNRRFYLRVNDTGRNFRLVSAPDSDPGSRNWSELVPTRNDVKIDDFDLFAHNLVLTERFNGLPQLALAKLPDGTGDPSAGGKLNPPELAFNEPDYTVALGDNYEFDPPSIRLTYTSLTTPQRVFDQSLSDGSRTLMKQQFVGGGFDQANFREERLFATAKDGTRIPVSLVYRVSDAPGKDHPRPLLMEGYGSYGDSNDVYFSSTRLCLLDRGVAYAVAHVRGGGEYGRAWYDAGRMQNKQNTFGDFVAAAEFLEREGYTSRKLLAIEGASAGGLLIGAVVNQKPQLFRAAVADVPWVDVLADMSDPSVPLTTLEYKEWGNPNIPEQRKWITDYDPYTNVRPQAYPAMLVRESLNDSQVQFWDATRWVAKLRAAKKKAKDRSRLLLEMNMDAGHGGASGRDAELSDEAFDDAWILSQLSANPS